MIDAVAGKRKQGLSTGEYLLAAMINRPGGYRMKLFRFTGSQAYRTLYYKDKEVARKYLGKLTGISLTSEWKKYEAEVRFKGEMGDFEPEIMDFGGLVGVVLTSKARKIVEDLILPFGELLPLELDSSVVYLINPTIILDCVDYDKSEKEIIPPLNNEKITKYFFKKEIDYPPIFRLKNEPRKHIINDEFAIRLKENNLVGYELRELWNSNS